MLAVVVMQVFQDDSPNGRITRQGGRIADQFFFFDSPFPSRFRLVYLVIVRLGFGIGAVVDPQSELVSPRSTPKKPSRATPLLFVPCKKLDSDIWSHNFVAIGIDKFKISQNGSSPFVNGVPDNTADGPLGAGNH